MLKAHDIVYLVDFSRIKANELNQLRKKFKEQNSIVKMAKNKLIAKAISQITEREELKKLVPFLKNSTTLIFSTHPARPALLLKKIFLDDSEKYFKAALINGNIYSGAEGFNITVKLKDKNELLASIILSLKSTLPLIIHSLKTKKENE